MKGDGTEASELVGIKKRQGERYEVRGLQERGDSGERIYC